MTIIALATEDMLSEAVGLRLLDDLKISPANVQCLRKDGSGYLRSKMANWKQLSRLKPVLLITDLDRVECPVRLRADWIGQAPAPTNLLIRIAVREIESWLMADHDAMHRLLGLKIRLPVLPDELPDPKRTLLHLAKSADRAVRRDLVKEKGAVASQGIGYNARLRELVLSFWSAEKAASRSASLARTRHRLQQMVVALK